MPGVRQAKDTTNLYNGSYAKMVSWQVGDIAIAVPQDREWSFALRLVPKGSRRLDGVDEMIVSLYAGPMAVRGIQPHPGQVSRHQGLARQSPTPLPVSRRPSAL